MVGLSAEQLARGVICASAGNHAQGVAMSAQRLGCAATIVMPHHHAASEGRRRARRSAREVVLHGDSYSDAAQHAIELQQQHGVHLRPSRSTIRT